MSSEKAGSSVIYRCDQAGCKAYHEVEGMQFKEAWAETKMAGWRCFKNEEGTWVHKCPGHVRSSGAPRRTEDNPPF